jgi:hypothetical protein
MGYPLIIAYKGDEFARVNHDGQWSVLWDKTLNVRFEKPTPRNVGIIGAAIVLLAAKDNFLLTPWDESTANADKWDKKSKPWDISDRDPVHGVDPYPADFTMEASGLHMARVNYDGSWSVNWDNTDQVARMSFDKTNWRPTAIVSFCRLLMAAQYRFLTVSWPKEETDDE